MAFNFMSNNFLSRVLAGTVTLVTILGVIPGIAQASSQQVSPKNHGLPIKNNDGDDPLFDQLRILGDDLLRILGDDSLPKAMAETSYETGNSLMQKKDFQGAIQEYNQAIQIYPQYAEAYTNRAMAKAQLGDQSGAVADLQQAAALFQQQGNTQAYQQVQQLLQQAQ